MTHAFRGRGRWLWIVGAAVVAATLLYFQYEIRLVKEQNEALLQAYAEERAATRARGDTPVGPDPSKLLDDPRFRGAQGDRGPRGFPGQPGRDGTDGSDGQDGEPGRDGEDGRDGVDGQNGTDGQPGRDGTDGADGADGRDGQPPASWSWTDPGTGRRYTCTRDEGSPDSAPTYTCTPDGRPGPIP